MKKIALVPILLCFYVSLSFAQKDTCTVGIYIHSLDDFKLEDNSFMADFWLWQTYRSDSLNLENAIEIINNKSAEFSHYSLEMETRYYPGEALTPG